MPSSFILCQFKGVEWVLIHTSAVEMFWGEKKKEKNGRCGWADYQNLGQNKTHQSLRLYVILMPVYPSPWYRSTAAEICRFQIFIHLLTFNLKGIREVIGNIEKYVGIVCITFRCKIHVFMSVQHTLKRGCFCFF